MPPEPKRGMNFWTVIGAVAVVFAVALAAYAVGYWAGQKAYDTRDAIETSAAPATYLNEA